MASVADLLRPLSMVFPASRNGSERARWFVSTMLAIIMPFSTARTSNLLRALHWVFGESVSLRRYYTFMATPKLRWAELWSTVWMMIPSPYVDERLLVAIDDSINPKTGRKIFGCEWFFDHAAKANQTRYAWAQLIVTIGLLKPIKGGWACLPLAFRFYHSKKAIAAAKMTVGRTPVTFQTKIEQAREMLIAVARAFDQGTILAVTEWIYRKTSWVALFTTDLNLTVEQVIEYYAARWKIEAAFKELKQEIGSARSQTRNPVAVTNHLHFCMMAATLTWIHTDQTAQTPARLHNATTRRFYAFFDARRQFTDAVKPSDLRTLCPDERIRHKNSFLSILVKMAA